MLECAVVAHFIFRFFLRSQVGGNFQALSRVFNGVFNGVLNAVLIMMIMVYELQNVDYGMERKTCK